jgi:hypothetical protein
MSNSAFNQSQTGNASEAGAGVVQKATPAEIEAGTDVGSSGAPLFVVPSLIPSGGIVEAFEAYEDIAKGDAVGLSNFTPGATETHYTHEVQTATESIPNGEWRAQKFTMPDDNGKYLAQIGFWMRTSTGGPFNATIRIRSSLTGPDIFSLNAPYYSTPYYTWVTPPKALVPGQDYYAIITTSQSDPTKCYLYYGTAVNPLPGGERWGSSDFGATWSLITSSNTNVYNIRLVLGTPAGLGHNNIFKANAASSNGERFSFFGYALEETTAGNIVPVVRSRMTDIHTGLIPGRQYYLQNIDGQIGLEPGSVRIPLGIAVSGTKLYRNRGVSDHFGFNPGVAWFDGICGQYETGTAGVELSAYGPIDYSGGEVGYIATPSYASEGGNGGLRVSPGTWVNSAHPLRACMIYPQS